MQKNAIFPVAGQLAYFLILSMFPFIMVFLNILSQTALVREDVLLDIIKYLPIDIQNIIIQFVQEVVQSSSQGLLSAAAILGIWSASSGTRAVIRAINNAYDKRENRSFIRLSIMSVIFTLGILILLTLVFAALVFGEVIGQKIFNKLGQSALFYKFWSHFRILILIFYMIFIFGLLYKFSPASENKISLKSTLPGALFSTIGWIVVSLLFSYYVNNFGNFNLTYGSLVGIIVLLIWLYITSIIILLGGEINASLMYLNTYGFHLHKDKSLVYNLNDRINEKST